MHAWRARWPPRGRAVNGRCISPEKAVPGCDHRLPGPPLRRSVGGGSEWGHVACGSTGSRSVRHTTCTCTPAGLLYAPPFLEGMRRTRVGFVDAFRTSWLGSGVRLSLPVPAWSQTGSDAAAIFTALSRHPLSAWMHSSPRAGWLAGAGWGGRSGRDIHSPVPREFGKQRGWRVGCGCRIVHRYVWVAASCWLESRGAKQVQTLAIERGVEPV
jgi:hypothetical protein